MRRALEHGMITRDAKEHLRFETIMVDDCNDEKYVTMWFDETTI
jgi:hypothetical protein